MSNPLLGELEIKLGDEKFTLRPTFEGLMQVEQRSGCSIAQLSKKIMTGIIGIQDATSIIYGGIFGYCDGKPKFTYEEIGNKVMKHGYVHLLDPIGKFVAAALMGMSINDIDTSSEDSKKKDTDPEPTK